jgi:hypothetical protein
MELQQQQEYQPVIVDYVNGIPVSPPTSMLPFASVVRPSLTAGGKNDHHFNQWLPSASMSSFTTTSSSSSSLSYANQWNASSQLESSFSAESLQIIFGGFQFGF